LKNLVRKEEVIAPPEQKLVDEQDEDNWGENSSSKLIEPPVPVNPLNLTRSSFQKDLEVTVGIEELMFGDGKNKRIRANRN